MQPTFVPWAGYCRLIATVDQFVFLDDAQLSKQSWQTRNRVLVNGEEHWLSVPIRHDHLGQLIQETRLAPSYGHWRYKIERLLRQSYARRPFYDDLCEAISFIEKDPTSLSQLNCTFILAVLRRLDVHTPTSRSSEMQLAQEDRTDRLIEIGNRLDCNIYVSPIGARKYLEYDGFMKRSKFGLEFLGHAPPPYAQGLKGEFIPRLSILDVIANLGWQGTADYISRDWLIEEGDASVLY